jgi:hypothetical protein
MVNKATCTPDVMVIELLHAHSGREETTLSRTGKQMLQQS